MANRPWRERMIPRLIKEGGTIAEIGVFRGAFSERLLQLIKPEKLYLVDPWENLDDPEIAGSYYHADAPNDMNAIHDEVRARFAGEIERGQVETLRGTSRDLAGRIDDASLDFAYIDGDHRFEGVLADLDILAPKTKIGGVLMLDDHKLDGWWGDGVVSALNTFLGRNTKDWLVARAAGGQVAIRRIR